MEHEQITVSLYENAVPPFVEADMETLYGHIYSSLPQLRIYGGIDSDTHTYVTRHTGKTSAVLLFRIERGTARVLNEQISIGAKEIERFARHIFDAFPSTNVVSFNAVQTDAERLTFPCQRFYRTEDIVLDLPSSTDEYLAHLGKATRKNIKYYSNRLKRIYPALAYSACQGSEVNPQHVRELVALNKARMAMKNKESEMDGEETERLIRLAQQHGLVCVMTLDGRIVAGTICSRIGANYFLHVVAHDPAYDDTRIGTLCCYQTICECIARGGREFHFLWGRFDYKYWLLGVQHDFDELVIYRSHFHLMFNAGTALRTAFNGYLRETKLRLLDIANRPEGTSLASRLAFRFLNQVRNLKRSFALPAHKN